MADILAEFLGRYWDKKDLKLLELALDRGQDDIADLTEHEYDVLSSAIKHIKELVK